MQYVPGCILRYQAKALISSLYKNLKENDDRHGFIPSLAALRYMLEEFCEGNHCDQYIHPVGGSFAQCLMVQRELSRVSACPLRYDKIVAKAVPEERTGSHRGVRDRQEKKKGFPVRSK